MHACRRWRHHIRHCVVKTRDIVRSVVVAVFGSERERLEIPEARLTRHILTQREHLVEQLGHRIALCQVRIGTGAERPLTRTSIVRLEQRLQLRNRERRAVDRHAHAAGDLLVRRAQLLDLRKTFRIRVAENRHCGAELTQQRRDISVVDARGNQQFGEPGLSRFDIRLNFRHESQVARFGVGVLRIPGVRDQRLRRRLVDHLLEQRPLSQPCARSGQCRSLRSQCVVIRRNVGPAGVGEIGRRVRK